MGRSTSRVIRAFCLTSFRCRSAKPLWPASRTEVAQNALDLNELYESVFGPFKTAFVEFFLYCGVRDRGGSQPERQ
jgi:hypothetical protein